MSEPTDTERLLELMSAPLRDVDDLRRKVTALGVHADRVGDDNSPFGEAIANALVKIKHAREALEAVEYKVIEVHERQNE